jgi:hypothetical protein
MSINDAGRARLEKPAGLTQSRPRNTHIWARDALEFYTEPCWVDKRLFEVERFTGIIHDPFCGSGRVIDAARAHGYQTIATDAVDRGYEHFDRVLDFFQDDVELLGNNIITNPPYAFLRESAERGLDLGADVVAMICPMPRLPAAHWLQRLPLARIHALTPRPSMPPGDLVAAGMKAAGGRPEFCWLVFRRDHFGPPAFRWLHRDGAQS